MKIPRLACAVLFVCCGMPFPALGQEEKPVPVCSRKALAALKELPKVEYECPEDSTESDDKILKLPQRLAALRRVITQLEGFTSPAWWQVTVDELNACSLHKAAGSLTDDEKKQWREGDYNVELMGSQEMRLALLEDPCYQTGYSGANAFLLLHKNGKVFVSQLLNGYYSRVGNSIVMSFATLNGRQLIELSTSNSMPPSYWNYYFEIDPVTNKAAPKNLFREGGKPTNKIYSDMLMVEPADVGLPKDASELNVFRNGKLAQSFSLYEENERGKIEANGRKLRRIIYRWNGRFYAAK